MKKKIKIILLSMVALILIGGGYLLYIFQFKEYEVADEEVDEIIENPYDIELPDGTKLIVDEIETKGDKPLTSDKSVNGDKKTTDGSSSGSVAGATTNVTDSDKKPVDAQQPSKENAEKPSADKPSAGNNGSSKPVEKATVASIKGKYTPTLNSLQGQVDGKINALIGRAKSEYSSKKANGESVNYAYFYNKYMSAANGLEAQTDAVFEGVVGALERDLQANGYDKSYSQSVRDEYAATKKARRESILSKAIGR